MKYKYEFLLCILISVPSLLVCSTLIGMNTYDDSINTYVTLSISDYFFTVFSVAVLYLLLFIFLKLSEMEEKNI